LRIAGLSKSATFKEVWRRFCKPERALPGAGLENFEITDRPAPETKVTTSGHIFNEDVKVVLDAEKNGLGFTRLGWLQFRKYDDDSGGYYQPFFPSIYTLDRDLHTDVGRAWADFGLTLPHWPRIVHTAGTLPTVLPPQTPAHLWYTSRIHSSETGCTSAGRSVEPQRERGWLR